MFGAFTRKTEGAKGRVVDVGWLITADNAGFIWEAPRKLAREEAASAHAKSVRYCPAAIDHKRASSKCSARSMPRSPSASTKKASHGW